MARQGHRGRLMAGTLLVPVVTAGYVGLTLFLFVPLLGLRSLFSRRSTVKRPAHGIPIGHASRARGTTRMQ